MEEDKFLDKVKKLISKAKGTDNENESNIFLAKANQLLLEKGMSINDIPTNKKKDINVLKSQYGDGYDEGQWEASLITTIADHNLCRAIINPKFSQISVYDKSENVEISIYMFEVCREYMRTQSRKRYSQYRKDTLNENPQYTEKELKDNKTLLWRNVFIRNYLKGAVIGLHEKLYIEKETFLRESQCNQDNITKENYTDKNLPIPTNILDFRERFEIMRRRIFEEIDDFIENDLPDMDLKESQIRIKDESIATNLGIKDGKNVTLNKGVDYSDNDIRVNLLSL